ncbi:septal ring lytic transglycosylase RlpA family protein [soil metagenome]
MNNMYKIIFHSVMTAVLAGSLASCAPTRTPTPGNPASWRGYKEEGKASYYANHYQGKTMANGQPYRKGKLIAAHKQMPFGTKVKVTNLDTGRSVKVVITDRGPFVRGRVIDLSRKAARRVGMIDAGVVPVKVKVIRTAPGNSAGSSTARRE